MPAELRWRSSTAMTFVSASAVMGSLQQRWISGAIHNGVRRAISLDPDVEQNRQEPRHDFVRFYQLGIGTIVAIIANGDLHRRPSRFHFPAIAAQQDKTAGRSRCHGHRRETVACERTIAIESDDHDS